MSLVRTIDAVRALDGRGLNETASKFATPSTSERGRSPPDPSPDGGGGGRYAGSGGGSAWLNRAAPGYSGGAPPGGSA
jgi:hypothetical protein